MKRIASLLVASVALVCVVAARAPTSQPAGDAGAAIDAYRARKPPYPFPEGTVIARLAWSYDASAQNNKAFGKEQSFVAGHPKNGVQFMVKDSKKYASTGGWGYSQFDDGKPLTDQAALQSCFDCHQAFEHRDYVFTEYAP